MQYPPNRRSFIIATGLTALAATRVLGANDTLRVGVIGAGGRMNDLLNSADKAGTYQIVAVSDVYAPRRDAVKSPLRTARPPPPTWITAKSSSSPSTPSSSPSPDHWHVRMAVDALAAGKDVYLEKPVTHTIEEGATLLHAVRSSKQILQCGMQQRSWSPLPRCRRPHSRRQPWPHSPGQNLLVAELSRSLSAQAHRHPSPRLEAVARRRSRSALHTKKNSTVGAGSGTSAAAP